jgi:hypothetical protein
MHAWFGYHVLPMPKENYFGAHALISKDIYVHATSDAEDGALYTT